MEKKVDGIGVERTSEGIPHFGTARGIGPEEPPPVRPAQRNSLPLPLVNRAVKAEKVIDSFLQ